MNISDVLDAIEDKVQAKTIARVSGEDRKTKGIVYEASGGRLFGLDLDRASVEPRKNPAGSYRLHLRADPAASKGRVRLVLEYAPPGSPVDWEEIDRIAGLERVDAGTRLANSAWQIGEGRLGPGKQQIVWIRSLAALDALLEWYAAGSPGQASAQGDMELNDTRSEPHAAPVNLILYGPPGTGKTYTTAAEAVRLCDGERSTDDPETVRRRYGELVRTGQIRFVTFHQSYAYEDFVEGLRPTTGETEDGLPSAGFRLVPKLGVFREIATLAEQARNATAEVGHGQVADLDRRRFWKMALGAKDTEEHVYQTAVAGHYVALGWGGDVDFSDPRFAKIEAVKQEWCAHYPDDTTPSHTSQPWKFRNAMKVGDIVIVPYGNTTFRAVAEITGDYYFELGEDGTYNHRRKVRWLLVLDEPLPLDTIVEGNFTMRTLYELPRDRIRVEALQRLIGGPAPVVGSRRPDQFVLIIDEINRANVSKVFGELITLLEPDKRLGRDNALTVTLPYSGDTFGVPDNLHVIGTMNTADRSIALLDTALRRRFAFRELAPQPELLRSDVDGIDLAAVLSVLNARIEYLVDR